MMTIIVTLLFAFQFSLVLSGLLSLKEEAEFYQLGCTMLKAKVNLIEMCILTDLRASINSITTADRAQELKDAKEAKAAEKAPQRPAGLARVPEKHMIDYITNSDITNYVDKVIEELNKVCLHKLQAMEDEEDREMMICLSDQNQLGLILMGESDFDQRRLKIEVMRKKQIIAVMEGLKDQLAIIVPFSHLFGMTGEYQEDKAIDSLKEKMGRVLLEKLKANHDKF